MKRSTLRTQTGSISKPRCAPTQNKDGPAWTKSVPGVVGVRVPAGSLEAFRSFIETVPADGGMAFVLAPCLDAREQAALMELGRELGKRTGLHVSPAEDGDRLRASTVYVGPAGAEIGVEKGRLRVTPHVAGARKRGLVDRFFTSLARDRGRWATAIVLEGGGADGVRGLEAIRREGGLAVGQEAKAAPSSLLGRAIKAGLVDRVLPLTGMLEVLQERFVERAAESTQIRRRVPAAPHQVDRAASDRRGPGLRAGSRVAEPTLESDSRRATRLEQELTLAKEQLRSALEQLSTSSEELQSTNEELRVANEELRVANEELQLSNDGLERSREELQSMNEELAAVNAQLQEKVAEVTQSGNDLANLFASTDIGKILLDPALRVMRFTAPATSVFALKASDKGRPLTEIRMLTEYPGFFDDARAVAAGGPPVEAQVRGGGKDMIARLTPYRTQEGRTHGVVATFVDVTSLELARRALRENAEQLEALFEHVAVGIVITDLEGLIVDVNPAACTMLGWEREALRGRPFAPQPNPETGRHERDLHDDLVAGKCPFYDSEERYLCADGTILWASGSVSLIRPGDGRPARVVHVLQDVSEVRRIEKQLRAQEGLARLGEMAAAIAHEVRSPLMAVLAAVDILATRIPAGDDERRVVGEIRRRIASVDGLVRDLLLFARPTDLRFTRLFMRALLQEATDLLRRSGELGEVTVTLAGDEAEVLGDAELLRSVFVNLANNAAQAMKGKGALHVEVKREGHVCVVLFSDTGPGVPAAVAARIFEPFFTTRSRGIGLGLSLAKRIVEAHGGDIALLPSQGRGTTLSITLPVACG